MDLRQDPLAAQLIRAVDAALSGARNPSVELADIGIPALSLPEELGGYGLGLSADVAVNGRLGYQLEPVPAYRETVLALELLPSGVDLGPVGQLLLDGAAHAVAVGVHDSAALRLDGAGRLWGDTAELPESRYALVVARASADDGRTVWLLVDPEQAAVRTVASARLEQPHVRFSFDGAEAREVAVSEAAVWRALDRARVRNAALLLGVADRALETARAHVNRRIQYGEPLIKLQTISHRLARMVGIGDGWRLLLHETAWQHDRELVRAGDSALVLGVAADHALECSRLGIQLHGVRGMLAHSTAAAAYRIASVEAIRLGTPQQQWITAGHAGAGSEPHAFAVAPAAQAESDSAGELASI
jgi:alkylation response protein AidB-like acyl-CoA dehydrogenase